MDERIVRKFWHYVDKNGPVHQIHGQCWLTTVSPNVSRAQMRVSRQKKIRTSRLSWEIHHGPIPEGLYVLHKCDNPRCVNPDHLFLGTQLDNVADCRAKKRNRKAHGEDHLSAKLTESDVLKIRRLYSSGLYTYKSLAERLGVTKSTVRKAATGRTWKCVGKG